MHQFCTKLVNDTTWEVNYKKESMGHPWTLLHDGDYKMLHYYGEQNCKWNTDFDGIHDESINKQLQKDMDTVLDHHNHLVNKYYEHKEGLEWLEEPKGTPVGCADIK